MRVSIDHWLIISVNTAWLMENGHEANSMGELDTFAQETNRSLSCLYAWELKERRSRSTSCEIYLHRAYVLIQWHSPVYRCSTLLAGVSRNIPRYPILVQTSPTLRGRSLFPFLRIEQVKAITPTAQNREYVNHTRNGGNGEKTKGKDLNQQAERRTDIRRRMNRRDRKYCR